MAKKFDQSPEERIPKVFTQWSEAKAVYQFFNNEQVTSEKIYELHAQQTLSRLKDK